MPDSAQSFSSPNAPSVAQSSVYGRFSFIRSKALLVLILLVLTASAGFAGGLYYQSSKADQIRTDLEKSLPLSLDILTNATVTEWRGVISGQVLVVDNTTSSLIVKSLVGPSSTITVKKNEELTKIYRVANSPSGIPASSTEIEFSDIKPGDEVGIDAWLPIQGKSTVTGVEGDIVARVIYVNEK